MNKICPQKSRRSEKKNTLLWVDNEFTPTLPTPNRPILVKFGTTGLVRRFSGFFDFRECRLYEGFAFLSGLT
jgi:hypothetical protein